MQREITELEEQAYRLCHHDFDGLTVIEAAGKMGAFEHIVRRLLKSLKRKAPQLFPILTKRQFLIYKLRTEKGHTQQEIAGILQTTQSNVQEALDRMKDQGMPGLNVEGLGDTVSYDGSMDKHVKQRF